ncbi:hypothetical protein ABEW68_33690, partial [Paenibacillus lautus]|uniref:hypothetical protein n=1 Tax=Paenibacillus lautus TaxID=1401 RepID=UPI003D26E1DD
MGMVTIKIMKVMPVLLKSVDAQELSVDLSGLKVLSDRLDPPDLPDRPPVLQDLQDPLDRLDLLDLSGLSDLLEPSD